MLQRLFIAIFRYTRRSYTGDELNAEHRRRARYGHQLGRPDRLGPRSGRATDRFGHSRRLQGHLIEAFQPAQTLGLDLLMTTGGVSVGDCDQVKQALTESGMTWISGRFG